MNNKISPLQIFVKSTAKIAHPLATQNGEPIKEHTFDIYYYNEEDDGDDKFIGTINIISTNIKAEIIEASGSYSQDMYDTASLLFASNNYLSSNLIKASKLLENKQLKTFFYIDKISIDEDFKWATSTAAFTGLFELTRRYKNSDWIGAINFHNTEYSFKNNEEIATSLYINESIELRSPLNVIENKYKNCGFIDSNESRIDNLKNKILVVNDILLSISPISNGFFDKEFISNVKNESIYVEKEQLKQKLSKVDKKITIDKLKV